MAYTTVDNPLEYFNTKLYTGNAADGSSTTQDISGVGFQPDWVWLKSRDTANNHVVDDSVRGANKHLFPDLTNVENTSTNYLKSFASDGFQLGPDGAINGNGDTYVAWNWKAGTSFSNSSGSNGANLDSSGSVSTTAGISIVSFTGNRSTTRNIYHGLGAVPKIMIFKNRDGTNGWTIYHEAIGNANKLTLNNTSAAGSCSACFASTDPTSTLFSVGDDGDTNGTSEKMIAYCFSEVKGYSRISNYSGNNSTNGPVVYCGFKPAWIMIKNTEAAEQWRVYDNKRDPFNHMFRCVFPNANNGDNTTDNESEEIDFLSNGIKIRSDARQLNGDGQKLIYMAFAEAPLVTGASAIPTTAR